jgi:autotransporter-associated beta strand protein
MLNSTKTWTLLAFATVGLVGTANAAVIYKDQTTTDINTLANWSTTSGASTPDPTSFTNSTELRFNEYFASTNGTNYTANLSADLTVGAVCVDSGSAFGGAATGNIIISGTNTLTLMGAGDPSYATSGIVLNSATGGTLTINANLAIGASQLWTLSRTLTVNGNVNLGSNTLTVNTYGATYTSTIAGSISGTGGLTKGQSMNLNLTGSNSFTGATTVSAGILGIHLNSLANSSSVTLNGGSLAIGYNGTTSINNLSGVSGTIIRTDYNVGGSGNGARTLSVNQTTDGTYAGTFTEGASRPISLIKAGAGKMRLSGSNTYTGNTTVNNGILDLTGGQLYTSAHNSAAVVTVNTGATLKVNSYAYGAANSLGMLSDYAARRVINGGILEVTGATQSSGNDFTVGANGGTFRYNPTNTADTLTLSGNGNTDIAIGGALTFDAIGNITVGGNMGGAGSVTKSGAGTLTLSASNAYAGGTTVNVGTLAVGNVNALGGGAVAVNGGTLNLGGNSVTNTISVGASGKLEGTAGMNLTNVTFADGAAMTGSFGSFNAGTSAAKVFNVTGGASYTDLSGQGTFDGGLVTVNGIHAPGNSPGSQTFTTGLTYGDGATVNLEFDNLIASTGVAGTNWDVVNVTGGLSIGANVHLNWSAYDAINPVAYTDAAWDTGFSKTLFTVAGGTTGSFLLPADMTVTGQGTWSLTQDTAGVYATWTAYVPEPGTFGLLALGALALLGRRRRDRR